MYTLHKNISIDNKGGMTGVSPDPIAVANILTAMFRNAEKLEKLYDVMMTEYSGENDFYAILSDISDIIDTIDKDELSSIRNAYGSGVIYSAADRWIIAPMFELYDNTVGSDGKIQDCLISDIVKTIDECEYVDMTTMRVYAAELYNCIAAMYMEIYNTYGLDRWIKAKTSELPIIDDITRGFNEFLVRVNMSVEEMADYVYEKKMKFIFVTNEVDRDPEIGNKIRSMVPFELKSRFDAVVELITSEQVESILNGKITINESFIVWLENDDDEDAGKAMSEVDLD